VARGAGDVAAREVNPGGSLQKRRLRSHGRGQRALEIVTRTLITIVLALIPLVVIDASLRRELTRHLVDPSEARFRGWRNLTYLEPARYTPVGRVWLRRLYGVKLAEVVVVLVAGLLLAPRLRDRLIRVCS
jgi:hypothetical protein